MSKFRYKNIKSDQLRYINIRKIIIFIIIMTLRDTKTQKACYCLKKEYLVENNYLFVKENNERLNQFFNQLCTIFISNYEALSHTQIFNNQTKNERNQANDKKDYPAISFLKKFISDFSNIMLELSNFQINLLYRQQQQNKPELDVYFQLMQQLKDLNSIYDSIDKDKIKLDPLFKQVKHDFITYKKSIENPINFYDENYVKKTNQQLSGNIDKASTYIKLILQKKQEIQTKIYDIEPTFSRFKCKLVKNKYNVLNKINHFVQDSKYCLIQFAQLLKQCVVTHKSLYLKLFQTNMDSRSQLKQLLHRSSIQISIQSPYDENKRWENAIKSTLNTYWRENEAVEKIFDLLQKYFNAVCKNYQEKKGKIQQIIYKMCQFYEDKQSPFNELIENFNMNENLQKKIQLISQKLYEIKRSSIENKRVCMKHGQVILSLIKIKTKREQEFYEYPDSMNKKDITDLVSQISRLSPKKNILQFFQFLIITQKQLLMPIKLSGKTRTKNVDSMEISHSTVNNFKVERKKPLRQEIWLWKQIKEKMSINFELYQQYFDDIRKFGGQIYQKFTKKEFVQLEKYNCFLMNRKSQVILILMSQGLVISANQLNISIKWKDIINIEQVDHFFDKGISITTVQGKIDLSKIKGDLQIILTSMKQIQEKSLMGDHTKIQQKKIIQLNPEQIKQILDRKQKIMKDVPNAKDFKLIIEETFENQRIDEIYDLIYSDKIFNFYGRQEPCFFSYVSKKAGNFNWNAEKYDQPGPQFYTLQEGVNFKNCPLFSTRKITYNHPMKPSSIPFMPKQSKNADQRRMYWVSHDQLVYLIKSDTSQVPMADNFQVQILHRITTVEKGVKIQIFSNIVFIKQTSFKNIIASNTNPEVDENMINFMAQIRRLLKLRKQLASGAQITIQIQPELIETKQTQQKNSEVSKLKLYNKILIAGLLILLLFNMFNFF